MSLSNCEEIINYWFPDNKFQKFWFKNDSELDKYIFEKYNYLIDYYYKKTHYDTWKDLLSGIIVLDQFTRHINRLNKINLKKYNIKAIELTNLWIENNYSKGCQFNYISFALMPFRHSNDISNYKKLLELLETLKNSHYNNPIFNKFYKHTKLRYNKM